MASDIKQPKTVMLFQGIISEKEGSMPDICTSLRCKDLGSDYCNKCSHANSFGDGIDENGKKWAWTFNPMFGPIFQRKDGVDMKRQPSEKSPAWGVFETWIKKRRG